MHILFMERDSRDPRKARTAFDYEADRIRTEHDAHSSDDASVGSPIEAAVHSALPKVTSYPY